MARISCLKRKEQTGYRSDLQRTYIFRIKEINLLQKKKLKKNMGSEEKSCAT